MVLNYAECFNVYYCTDGYKLLDVKDGAQYLLVPDGKEAPDDLDSDVIVIHQPLERIYMAATSPMALFDAIDSLDTIRLSGETADNWYVQDAVDAMNAGTMIFAGKYSEPDYELLVSENCDLAIESTMILHSPKVQEMIEMLDIPVFIDRSSYESQPLGRTEWIKLYGAMLDKEEEAADFFASQASVVENLKDFQNTEKTVAFFYINTSGAAVVRNPEDYISNMIELGGARNAFRDLQDDSGKTIRADHDGAVLRYGRRCGLPDLQRKHRFHRQNPGRPAGKGFHVCRLQSSQRGQRLDNREIDVSGNR